MGVYTVRLGDAIRPSILRVGKTREEMVLTRGGANQNYAPSNLDRLPWSIFDSAFRRMHSAPKCTYMLSEGITHSKKT